MYLFLFLKGFKIRRFRKKMELPGRFCKMFKKGIFKNTENKKARNYL